MKKIAIVLALAMLLPINAFALQTLSQDDMAAITAQDGVSIAVDDVKLYQNIGYITYTDVGGTNGVDGSLTISNLYMMVNINAITHLDAAGLPVSPGRAIQGVWDNGAGAPLFNFNNTDTDADGVDDAFTAKPINIDVGLLGVLSEGLTYNEGAPTAMAGVRIGLPTMEIHQTALTFSVTVATAGAFNDGASYGTISLGENTMGVLDGFVEIAPH